MIPETHQINQIRLYKSVKFPMKWKLAKVLMKNVSAADTFVIKRSNTWFMFTNICSSGIHDHTSELHIFYSENILSQNWKPIKSGNPVIFDSMTARNGGVFTYNNNIYRVNQVHGKGHYGKSFSVNKIIEISKTKYQETRIFEINPNFKNKIKSTHHFSANDEIAVVDFCRGKRLKH